MNKQEYIQSLKDEVKQFHPFLKRLFMAMEKHGKISMIDYTHGPNENGSDFVLRENGDLLDEDVYIGVIVKTGPLKKVLDEVESQIKESKAVRKDKNGNDISIRKFWGGN